LLAGADPADQLGNIKETLETTRRIKEIRESIADRETDWKKKIDDLPNKEKTNELNRRLKALKFNSKNPIELAKSAKEAGKIIKEAKQNIKAVSQASQSIGNDFKKLQADIKGLEQAHKDDLKSLQRRLKIPKLDAKNIAFMLFGDQVEKYTSKIDKYTKMARKYLPEKSAGTAKEKLKARTRAGGKNFKFATAKSYPLFWLKNAKISSKAVKGSMSGNLSGQQISSECFQGLGL